MLNALIIGRFFKISKIAHPYIGKLSDCKTSQPGTLRIVHATDSVKHETSLLPLLNRMDFCYLRTNIGMSDFLYVRAAGRGRGC